MPHTENSIADDIAKIKDVLLERGRNKGELEDPDTGKVCLVGAIGAANGIQLTQTQNGYTEDRGEAYQEVMALPVAMFIKEQISDNTKHTAASVVYRFNDNAELDSEVFDFLDEAQIAAKEQARDAE